MVQKTRVLSRFVSVMIGTALLAGLLSACSFNIPQVAISNTPSTATVSASPVPAMQQLRVEPTQPTQILATFTPETLAATCLVGTWSVSDLQQAIADSYSRSQSPLALQSVEGETRYTFDENGGMEIVFNNLSAVLTGTIEGKEIKARNLLFGTATAQYRLNVKTREIVFSAFGGDGIQFATEINGQVLAQGNFPAWRAFSSNLAGSSGTTGPVAGPTRVVSEAYAAIDCNGDEMRLQAIDPVPGPEMKLHRVLE